MDTRHTQRESRAGFPCPTCCGDGRVDRWRPFGRIERDEWYIRCERCEGTGKVPEGECAECGCPITRPESAQAADGTLYCLSCVEVAA